MIRNSYIEIQLDLVNIFSDAVEILTSSGNTINNPTLTGFFFISKRNMYQPNPRLTVNHDSLRSSRTSQPRDNDYFSFKNSSQN